MDFFYRIYFGLPDFKRAGPVGGAMNWFMQTVLKAGFDFWLPGYFRRTASAYSTGLYTGKPRDTKIVVSLTTYPGRIGQVWLTIETILRQNTKPDHLILWLAEDQFPERILPPELQEMQQRGLTIRFCDDLRSHKKYYYALSEYPGCILITLDDDAYYAENTLCALMEAHKKYPDAVCANRAHKMQISEQGYPESYRYWKRNYRELKSPSHALVQTGVSGVLYPPGSLSEQTLDKHAILHVCLHADDLWLKANAYLTGAGVVHTQVFNRDFISVKASQAERLYDQNQTGGNDIQFQQICDYLNLRFSVDSFKESSGLA